MLLFDWLAAFKRQDFNKKDAFAYKFSVGLLVAAEDSLLGLFLS